MKTNSNSRPILSQTENNATLWIGHLANSTNDLLAGQTFSCPSDGLLNNIQVYSTAVTQPGAVELTLHEFDPETKSWSQPISQSVLNIESNDTSKWLRFELEPVQLRKDGNYAFRLHTDNGIIGFGEGIRHAHKPFTFGQAWSSDSGRKGEKFFSYFSLAFKVEMCA